MGSKGAKPFSFGLSVHKVIFRPISIGTAHRLFVWFCTELMRKAGMADDNLYFRPEHWRERAQERLAMARDAKQPRDRERLLKVARSYQRLAVRAQDWKAVGEDQPPRAVYRAGIRS